MQKAVFLGLKFLDCIVMELNQHCNLAMVSKIATKALVVVYEYSG